MLEFYGLFYLNLAFFYELCDFPQIVRSDAIWGQMCNFVWLLDQTFTSNWSSLAYSRA